MYICDIATHTHWLNQRSKNLRTYPTNPPLIPANKLSTLFCLHLIVFLPFYILYFIMCARMFLFMLNLQFYVFVDAVRWNKLNKIECNLVQICNILIGIIYMTIIFPCISTKIILKKTEKSVAGFSFFKR